MMAELKYRYEALQVAGTTTWEVKRFPGRYGQEFDDALISTSSTDPTKVIEEAIERGSWA